jgi:hypothetical protein
MVIKRTQTRGVGWPLRPGYPFNAHNSYWHAVEINDRVYPLLWRPAEEMWTSGLATYSPEIVGCYDYRGLVSVIYQAPPSDEPVKWRRRR